MTFVLYTNTVSAHQLPLAREIVRRVGADNFRYVYTGEALQHGAQEVVCDEPWVVSLTSKAGASHTDQTIHSSTSTSDFNSPEFWLESCDVLLCGGIRPIDLLERRSRKGLKTCYQSERWFKPFQIDIKPPLSTDFLDRLSLSHLHLLLPGWIRMFVPSYRKMAKRFARLMKDDPNFLTLPIGPWAKKDFQRLGVKPEKMLDWGYFVAPSTVDAGVPNASDSSPESNNPTIDKSNNSLRVLWVGRMLALKRVDTVIRAVACANEKLKMRNEKLSIELTLVGDGPEKLRLQKLAERVEVESRSRRVDGSNIHSSTSPSHFDSPSPSTSHFDSPSTSTSHFDFLPSMPISEIRNLMRAHDVLVFASNAMDGWGAVVSEALAEGVPVIGTYETGAAAALLPDEQLFHCGDYRELAQKLISILRLRHPTSTLPPSYTPAGAVERLMKVLGGTSRSLESKSKNGRVVGP